VKPFTTLPKAVLFLRLENFSTAKAAQDAATSASAVVEWAGKIWLLTLGPKGVRNKTTRARAGEGMVAPANTPMQLNITGSSKRDAFFVVVHDASKPRVTPSDWQPTGTCK
jgi:hypothetical protein